MKSNSVREYALWCLMLFVPLIVLTVVDFGPLYIISMAVLILLAFREKPAFAYVAAIPAVIILFSSVVLGLTIKEDKSGLIGNIYYFMRPQLLFLAILLINEIRVKRIVSPLLFYIFLLANFAILLVFAIERIKSGQILWLDTSSFFHIQAFIVILFATMLSKRIIDIATGVVGIPLSIWLICINAGEDGCFCSIWSIFYNPTAYAIIILSVFYLSTMVLYFTSNGIAGFVKRKREESR